MSIFSQYFGNYLLNKGLLTPEQLRDALNFAASTRVKLGVLALQAGWLTAEQVEEIEETQRRVDQRFGEIAVKKGYLTGEQVRRLLQTQAEGQVQLGQVLLDRHYLTTLQLEAALQSYQREAGLTGEDLRAFREGDTDHLVRVLLDFPCLPHEKLFYDYAALFLRSILRLLGEEGLLGECLPARGFPCSLLVIQPITGEGGFYSALVLDEDTSLNLASRYGGTPVTSPELAEDAVKEFLNLVNGLFIVNMSNRGIEFALGAPLLTRKAVITAGQASAVPYHLSQGTLYVIISREKLP